MKRKLLVILFVMLFALNGCGQKNELNPDNIPLSKTEMKIQSSAFKHGENIPAKYTCDAAEISPPLTFSDIPENAQSLVLIVDDPDAPMGIWVHWTVWNISPETTEVLEGTVPANARQGKTTSGDIGYGGPCPPRGTHRYFFRLYALDSPLDLSVGALRKELDEAMRKHIIGQAELMGTYERRR